MKKTLDNYAGLPEDEVVKKLHKSKLDYEHILKLATKAYNDYSKIISGPLHSPLQILAISPFPI